MYVAVYWIELLLDLISAYNLSIRGVTKVRDQQYETESTSLQWVFEVPG